MSSRNTETVKRLCGKFHYKSTKFNNVKVQKTVKFSTIPLKIRGIEIYHIFKRFESNTGISIAYFTEFTI
jgi:hypothetical protein